MVFEKLGAFLKLLLNRELKSFEIPSKNLSNKVGIFVEKIGMDE